MGPVAYGNEQPQQYLIGQNQRNYSEEVASEIDKEVHKYLAEAYESCREIINTHRRELDLIAQALMEKETLTAAELQEIIDKVKAEEEEKSDPMLDLAKKISDVRLELSKAVEKIPEPI